MTNHKRRIKDDKLTTHPIFLIGERELTNVQVYKLNWYAMNINF